MSKGKNIVIQHSKTLPGIREASKDHAGTKTLEPAVKNSLGIERWCRRKGKFQNYCRTEY